MSWLNEINESLGISDPFKSSVEGAGFQEIPSSKEQDSARKYLNKLAKTTVKYPTQQVAGMTEAEQKGQDILNQFLGKGESPERAGALSYLQQTLDSPVNIMDLPEIKALLSTIESQTEDLVNSALRRTQIEGMGTSGPQGSAVGREIAKGKTSMVATIAPYLSEQRANKLTATGLINQLVTSGEGTTLNKLSAASSFGSLPREIENQKSDADYQKKVNDILAKYNLQGGAASAVLGETRQMYNPGVQTPSLASQLMPAVGAGIGAFAALSDERIKENFVPIDGALEKLGKLKGKTYNYKFNQPGNRDAGIMAGDLQAVLSEGVIERDGIKYVKLDALAALLVNAVNELHEIVQKKIGS